VRGLRVQPNTFLRLTEHTAVETTIETKNSLGQAICASQPLLWAGYSEITPGASTVPN
jgi:hypothetical protein